MQKETFQAILFSLAWGTSKTLQPSLFGAPNMFLPPTPQKEVAHICQVRPPCSPFNDPQVRGEKGDELKIAKPHLKEVLHRC